MTTEELFFLSWKLSCLLPWGKENNEFGKWHSYFKYCQAWWFVFLFARFYCNLEETRNEYWLEIKSKINECFVFKPMLLYFVSKCVLPTKANENRAMIQIHKQPLACNCAFYVPRNSGRNNFQNNFRFVK